MSLILLRNNLKKINSDFFCGSATNIALWSRRPTTYLNERQTPFANILLKKQLHKPRKDMIRGGTTAITIKQYQSSRKYTGLWKAERFAGIALIFMIPLAFCFESKEFEMVLGFMATLHTYWGCQSMCNDYVRSSVVGKVVPVFARVLNITLNLGALVGVRHLIYEDCGVIKMIKKFWNIRGNKDTDPSHK